MTHKVVAHQGRRNSKRSKKEISSVSPFQRKVAVSLLTQKVIAALNASCVRVKEQNGWNQADISRRIDIDEAQLSRLLTGRQPNMTIETIALLLAAMEHKPEFNARLMTERDNIKPYSTLSEKVRSCVDWELEINDETWGNGSNNYEANVSVFENVS